MYLILPFIFGKLKYFEYSYLFSCMSSIPASVANLNKLCDPLTIPLPESHTVGFLIAWRVNLLMKHMCTKDALLFRSRLALDISYSLFELSDYNQSTLQSLLSCASRNLVYFWSTAIHMTFAVLHPCRSFHRVSRLPCHVCV